MFITDTAWQSKIFNPLMWVEHLIVPKDTLVSYAVTLVREQDGGFDVLAGLRFEVFWLFLEALCE